METVIDYEFWRFWMAMLNFAGTLGVAIYIFLTNRSRVNSNRIDKFEIEVKEEIAEMHCSLRRDVDGHRNWLERMEERNKHFPTHEDLKRIYDKVNAQSDQLNQLAGESKAQNETLKLIHQYLMTEGKK